MYHPYAWTLAQFARVIARLNQSKFAPMQKWIDEGFAPANATTIKQWMSQSVIVYGLLTTYLRDHP